MKTVLVYSGGLDSTCLLSQLLSEKESADNVVCLNFYYGAKHNSNERAAAQHICSEYYGVRLELLDMDFMGKLFKSDLLLSGGDIPEGHYEDANMAKTVVPFRNGIMLSIAAGYAESIGFDRVAIANHAGDHAVYADCRGEFITAMNDAINLGTSTGIEVYSPFVLMDKGDIVQVGHTNGAPMHLSWTCYKGLDAHCGKCGACVERKEAFEKFNITDPTEYSV